GRRGAELNADAADAQGRAAAGDRGDDPAVLEQPHRAAEGDVAGVAGLHLRPDVRGAAGPRVDGGDDARVPRPARGLRPDRAGADHDHAPAGADGGEAAGQAGPEGPVREEGGRMNDYRGACGASFVKEAV